MKVISIISEIRFYRDVRVASVIKGKRGIMIIRYTRGIRSITDVRDIRELGL
jgi:hypothetical protein